MSSLRSFVLAGMIIILGMVTVAGIMHLTDKKNSDQKLGEVHIDAFKTIAHLFPRTQEHDFECPIPGTYKLPPIKQAGDGDVLDIHGNPLKLAELMKGKITILSFIYALCSDTRGCPLAMATLFDAHDASEHIPKIAKNTRFITLSFDPQRDTPEAMGSYGYPVLADPERDEKIPWDFLTTSSLEKLQPILKAYGQVVDPSADGETISHLLRLYLIDRQGRIRNIYGLGFLDPRLLFSDIETLLMEESARGRSNS